MQSAPSSFGSSAGARRGAKGERLAARRTHAPSSSERRGGSALPLTALLAVLACACGGSPDTLVTNPVRDEADLDGAASDSAHPAAAAASLRAGVYAGRYVVPTTAELEPYAEFELDAVRLDLDGPELTLRYDLPALLLGEPRRVEFRGQAGADARYTLAGEQGTASCGEGADGWVCDEVFESLELDLGKLERALAALPEPEARARRSVADGFSVDPIGVLHIRAR